MGPIQDDTIKLKGLTPDNEPEAVPSIELDEVDIQIEEFKNEMNDQQLNNPKDLGLHAPISARSQDQLNRDSVFQKELKS